LEQTSTTISLRVERVVKAFPHDVQRTVVGVSPGWTCFKEIPPSCLRWSRTNRQKSAGSTLARNKTLTGPCSFPQPSTKCARKPQRSHYRSGAEDPAARSGEESVDQEPDRHPRGDCERSEDDKESSQLATRLSLDLARGLFFTRPGKSIAGSGFSFDKSLSEDQEQLHTSIVDAEQDAGAHLLRGLPPTARLQEEL
jgi:hypothetical protein